MSGSGAGRAEKDQFRLAPRRSAEPTRTVREQFLVEITGEPTTGDGADQPAPGRATWASSTGCSPPGSRPSTTAGSTPRPERRRWRAGTPAARSRSRAPTALAEAFLWEAQRTVTKTALVSLQGNTYQVDPLLVGRRVELVFDPFDLTRIQVRLRGVPAGTAIPHRIGRHAHLKARPETPPEPPTPTGIDYARLHRRRPPRPARPPAAASTTPHSPAAPARPSHHSNELPGQLDLLTDLATDPTSPPADEVAS